MKQSVQLRRVLRLKAHTACHLYRNLHRLILELIPLLRDGNYEDALILIIALSCYKTLLLLQKLVERMFILPIDLYLGIMLKSDSELGITEGN